MYGIKIFFLFFIFFQSPGIAESHEPETTGADVQRTAFNLLDRVVNSVNTQNAGELKSTLDDGVAYYLSERNAIMSNLPMLISTVGPRVKQAAAATSMDQWNYLTNQFDSWTKERGQDSLVSSVTSTLRATGTELPKAADSTTEKGTVASGGVSGVTSGAKGVAASTTGSSSSAPSGLSTLSLNDSNAGATGISNLEVTDSSNSVIEKGREKGDRKVAQLLDLRLDRCYRLPSRARVECLAGKFANYCVNASGQRLPCP